MNTINTIRPSGLTFQQRIMRRVALIIMLVFAALIAGVVIYVQAERRDDVRQSTDLSLSLLTSLIQSELDEATREVVAIANNPITRDFARITSVTAAVQFGEQERVQQANLLRLFDELINQRRDRYFALRYIPREGRARGEVINLGVESQVVTEVGEVTYWSDPAYVTAALEAQPGAPFLSPVRFPEGYSEGVISVFVPVTASGTNTNILGVINAEMSIASLRDAVLTSLDNLIVTEPGRRVYLVDSLNREIARSAGAPVSDPLYLQLAGNPGAFSQRILARDLSVSTAVVDVFDGLNTPWRVVVVDDAALLSQQANVTSVMIVVLGVALMAVLLLIVNITLRPVMRPLADISARARGLATGEDADDTSASRSRRPALEISDELGGLLESISGISQRMVSLTEQAENQSVRRSRDLEVAARIGREVATLHNIDSLLNRSINLICDEFGFYHAQVFLIDDIGMNAVLAYSRGRAGAELLRQNFKIPVGSESVIGTVTATGNHVVINNTDAPGDIPHRANPMLPDTRAELALPLYAGEELIGALDIQSKKPGVFQPGDMPTYRLLADQLALAVYNARLVNQSNQRIQQVDTLNRQLTRTAWQETSDYADLQRNYRYNLLNVDESDAAPEDQAAALSAPISIRGEVIGTLTAAPPEGFGFTSGDEIILGAVASRVALAIENARLFQETQTTLSETSTLYQLSRYLNEADTLEDIVRGIINVVMRGAAGGQVWIFDDDYDGEHPEWLELIVDLPLVERHEHNRNLAGLRLRSSDHPFLAGLQNDQVTLVNDAREDARLDTGLKLILRRMGARGAIFIPLVVRGEWRGVISAYYAVARQFSSREGRIYTALIDQAGVAIDNRLLLQQTEEEVARNESLYAASRIINTAQNMQDLVYAAVATSSNPVFNFSLSLLEGKLDETGWPSQARMVARSNNGAVDEIDQVYTINLDANSPMREREPEIIIDDMPRNGYTSSMLEFMRGEGMRFMAVFPLFSANQPIALFHVFTEELNDLSSADYEVYRALTGQMSSQIQIRSLLERTEEALDETRRLYVASRSITSAQDAAEVYRSAVEHLAHPLLPPPDSGAPMPALEIGLLFSQPAAAVDAPYLQYVYHWKSGQGEIAPTDDWLTSDAYPYNRLTNDMGGAVYFADVAAGLKNDPVLAGEPRLLHQLTEGGVASALILPVRSRGRWFGVLACYSDRVDAFSEQYRRFAAALADQVAIAVENQTLFDEARYEAERAQIEAQRALALSEAAQLASRITDDFDRSIDEVFERVAEVAGFDRWMFMMLSDDGQRLEKFNIRAPGFDKDAEIYYDIATGIPMTDAVHQNQTLLVNDLAQYPAMSQFEEIQISSFKYFFGKHIAAPVITGRQMLGGLFMGRDLETADLDEGDQQLVETLAVQVAIALENRRLFQQAQNEQQTLRSILTTMPAGVLVLDAETLRPIQYNDQAAAFLGGQITDEPFSIERYNLYRTGTEMHYPAAEMPILIAAREGRSHSSDDVAVLLGDRQIDLLVDAAPITGGSGEVSAIVVAFQDITNLRSLENTLQENLRETVALYEAQRQLSETETIDDVLDVLIGQMMLLEPVDAQIVMFDDEDELTSVRTLMLPLDNPAGLSKLFDPRKVVHAPGIKNNADIDPALCDLLCSSGVNSVMTVPLRASSRGGAIGWIILGGANPAGFTLEQERTLEQLGDVASTAMDNRLLIETQRETVREVQSLYDATSNISQSRDLGQISTVLNTALDSLDADYQVGYLDESTGLPPDDLELFNVAGEGLAPVDFRTIFAGQALAEGSVFIEDLRTIQDPGPVEQQLMAAGIAAVGIVELRPRDVPGGFLIVAYTQPQQIKASERRYLITIADGASVVFNNIILFEQIQATLEETSILYQAGRALSDATTEQDILEIVVNYLVLPHIDQVLMIRLNSDDWSTPGANADIMAVWNASGQSALQGVALTEDQFAAWEQISTNTVHAISDIHTDQSLNPAQRAAVEGFGARSLVIIPLRVPQRVIGAIWIGSPEPYVYTDSEIRTYQAFGENASLSMEASYLLQQTDRRARQLETSAEVSQSAGKILDLSVLLPRIVNLIRGAFGYDHVQVFLMDDADEYAELRASTGEAGRQLVSIGHKLAKGSDSVIGMVTATGEPQIALDTTDADVVHYPNIYLPLTRSEMALPLIVQERVIGALDVQSIEPYAFKDEDVQVLTTLAAQISVAIDNANLYESAQDQAEKMGFLFEVTTAATAADTLDEALQGVASQLHDLLGALSALVYLPRVFVNDDEQSFTVLEGVALAGSEQPLSEIERIHLDDETNLISDIGRNMKPFVIDNIANEPRYLPVVSGARSAVILPMTSANELIGLIVLEDARANAYGYEVLQLLLTLTGSLSAVVQSTRLLEQLQATNEQLRELDRIKSDFLANMSHELRTPLNSIIGFSRVMLKGIDGPLTEMQEQDLTTIYNSGQHLLMLINDVLDQAKIAAGKMDLKFDFFEVKPLVEAVKSIGIGLVKDKPVNIVTDVAPNLPKAYGDEFRVRQVLLNLVSNAAKFTNEGGITIRIYPVRDHGENDRTLVRIDVEDTGIGIDEKDQPLLFEAFRQVDSSLTRTQGGTGLGLPIAKSLIEMQGGWMGFTSQVNVGSTFSITLPVEPTVEAGEEEETSEIEGEISPATKPTMEIRLHPALADQPNKIVQTRREVLLIEDNKDMVDQFRRVLQREGFEVQTADHPAYAEAMASNLRPTLIVMDVNFADGEGWNILARLKDRDDTFDIPVIVVTLSDESQRAYQSGVHHFIQRPFSPDDLVEAVLQAEKESNTERILIIDDQSDSVRLLSQLLNENGKYRVFSAESGAEGISLVARRRPDLIILDLRMPEMDGFAVLEELRSNPETAEIPVMVVTGEVDLKADEQAQLNNVHVLHKTDISQEEFDQFITDVRKHLDLNGNKLNGGD